MSNIDAEEQEKEQEKEQEEQEIIDEDLSPDSTTMDIETNTEQEAIGTIEEDLSPDSTMDIETNTEQVFDINALITEAIVQHKEHIVMGDNEWYPLSPKDARMNLLLDILSLSTEDSSKLMEEKGIEGVDLLYVFKSFLPKMAKMDNTVISNMYLYDKPISVAEALNNISQQTKDQIQEYRNFINDKIEEKSNSAKTVYIYEYEQKLRKQKDKVDKYSSKPHSELSQQEAYKQVVKTLLIGGMASGSRPYRHLVLRNEFDDQELNSAVQSLSKKHNPKFIDIKDRYKAVHNKKQSLRSHYEGVENVHHGYLYSHKRIEKYLEREGMLDAIQGGIAAKAKAMHINNVGAMFAEKINSLSAHTAIMPQCIYTLASAFIKKSEPAQDDEISKLIEMVAMLEIIDILSKSMDQTFSIDNYYKIMSMLNLMIVDRLLVNQEDRSQECFFKNLCTDVVATSISDTLVGNSGGTTFRTALDSIDVRLLGRILRLPAGVPLPDANYESGNTVGYFEWVDERTAVTNQPGIIIGRTSETKFNITPERLAQAVELIKQWSLAKPNEPNEPRKTLVVDISIPTVDPVDPILQAVMALWKPAPEAFDILIIRSEQKQQSLGLGKFAAGAAVLVSSDHAHLAKFNILAHRERSVDQKLATFYRENVSTAVAALVQAQSINAAKFVNAHKHLLDKCQANGPFVLCRGAADVLNKIVEKDAPVGYSFGFIIRNSSSWQTNQLRIDPGI